MSKSKNKDKICEACGYAANMMKSAEQRLMKAPQLNECSAIVKNDPKLLEEFLKHFSSQFNEDAWELTCYDLIRRFSKKDKNYILCVYDFYKALRDAKYFSAEKAISTIKKWGAIKSNNGPIVRRQGMIKDCPQYSEGIIGVRDWFITQINCHWRRVLALGSRVSVCGNRQLYWKTEYIRNNPITATKVTNDSFDIKIDGYQPDITKAQISAFLTYIGYDIFERVVWVNQYTVRIKVTQIEKVGKVTGPKNSFLTVPASSINILKPEMSPIEDHYAKQLESSVDEMVIILDSYDKQIFEISAKADKIRAQRSKLLRAIQELRK